MSADRKPDLHLEIAHVLFMDVVGFSKLLINDQSEILEQLNRLVRETPHFREAEVACGEVSLVRASRHPSHFCSRNPVGYDQPPSMEEIALSPLRLRTDRRV